MILFFSDTFFFNNFLLQQYYIYIFTNGHLYFIVFVFSVCLNLPLTLALILVFSSNCSSSLYLFFTIHYTFDIELFVVVAMWVFLFSLSNPDVPRTLGNLPTSVSQVLGLREWDIKYAGFKHSLLYFFLLIPIDNLYPTNFYLCSFYMLLNILFSCPWDISFDLV